MRIAPWQSSAVFPTPGGVFPSRAGDRGAHPGLPHARVGVSGREALGTCVLTSPRPMGCFEPEPQTDAARWVFPTPVGVFLGGKLSTYKLVCLPHARGGVSPPGAPDTVPQASSPAPWGCFRVVRHCFKVSSVFPTPVGVFPQVTMLVRLGRGLPHARGGVSIRSEHQCSHNSSSPRPWGCSYADKAYPATCGPSCKVSNILLFV